MVITTLVVLACTRHDSSSSIWHELTRHPSIEMHGEIFTWSDAAYQHACSDEGRRGVHFLASGATCPPPEIWKLRHSRPTEYVEWYLERANGRDDKSVFGFKLLPGHFSPPIGKPDVMPRFLRAFARLELRIISFEFENKLRQWVAVRLAEDRRARTVVVDAAELRGFEQAVDAFRDGIATGVFECAAKGLPVKLQAARAQRDVHGDGVADFLRRTFRFLGVEADVDGKYSTEAAVIRVERFVLAHPVLPTVCDISNVAALPRNVTGRFLACPPPAVAPAPAAPVVAAPPAPRGGKAPPSKRRHWLPFWRTS